MSKIPPVLTIHVHGNDHDVVLKINGNGFIELWCSGIRVRPSFTPCEARALADALNDAANESDIR